MIPHLENLELDDFYFFCENFRNGTYVEVSEKLDGNIALSFSRGKGQQGFVFSRGTKSKVVFRHVDEIPKEWKWNGYRFAVQAILHKEAATHIARKIGSGIGRLADYTTELGVEGVKVSTVHCEIIFGRQPNTIEYGGLNWVVFLSSERDGKKNKDYLKLKDIPKIKFHAHFIGRSGKEKGTQQRWGFKTNPIVTEFPDMPNFDKGWEEFKQIRRKKFNNPDLFFNRKMLLKQILVEEWVSKMSSQLGGQEVEGLVLKNLADGELVKIVDNYSPEGFTKRNAWFWKYRELCKNGTKVDGQWQKGVEALFKDWLAEFTGIKTIRSVNFKNIIDKAGGVQKFMEEKGILDGPGEMWTRRFQNMCESALILIDQLEKEYQNEQRPYPVDIQERTELQFEQTRMKFNQLKQQEGVIGTDTILELVYQYF